MNKIIKCAAVSIVSLILGICLFIPVSAQSQGEKIIEVAKKYIGNPYVYGGSSLTQGCDCSHFVWLVLQQAIQYQEAYATSWGFETLGEEVDNIQNAIAGDVICYGPHVAIYDGEGKIIQAKGRAYGITYDRQVDYSSIVTIRRFIDF